MVSLSDSAKASKAFRIAREISLSLPEVEEAPCYGTPGFRVRRKLFARLHDDGGTLIVRIDDSREALLEADPKLYSLCDHYRPYPWLLVNLASANKAVLQERLRHAWSLSAPRGLLNKHPELTFLP